MRAFVFPGQGAQTIGMGKALADAYPSARAVFDEVDEALGEKLSTLIWEGDIADLTLTKNAQPALMATSLAAMRALESEGVTIDMASFVAGHSLGEYSVSLFFPNPSEIMSPSCPKRNGCTPGLSDLVESFPPRIPSATTRDGAIPNSNPPQR